jgi:hypothetical protein
VTNIPSTAAAIRNTLAVEASADPVNAIRVGTVAASTVMAGWLASVLELAHADTYNDYLEMAEGLHGQGYKDPAAVIAGTSLEVHLRTLATKHVISLQAANGSPKKADTINADLKAAGVYSGLELKQVTAWLHLRNSAAHGHYGDYTDTDVRQLIDGVRSFASKYPA